MDEERAAQMREAYENAERIQLEAAHKLLERGLAIAGPDGITLTELGVDVLKTFLNFMSAGGTHPDVTVRIVSLNATAMRTALELLEPKPPMSSHTDN